MNIHIVDLIIILAYLLGITAIGLFSGRQSTRSSNNYFLAARSLKWPVVGMALFATNISTVHMIGLASSGFSEGMVVGNFEWLAPFLLIVLGLIFAPFYFRTKISTLPEYIEGRFGPVSRTILAVMAIFGALFIHIGVTLYAGAVVFQSFVDID
ncbi:MAG: sodium:glucose symporter, partial [bacterium]